MGYECAEAAGRELVAGLVEQGLTSRQIAARLRLSIATIRRLTAAQRRERGDLPAQESGWEGTVHYWRPAR